MKNIFVIGFLFNITLGFSQQNHEIFFTIFKNDTLIFYLDEVGDLTTKSNAFLYRKAYIDNKDFIYEGQVVDYYIENSKAYECHYRRGILSGEVKCFYKNGLLKYHGYYNESLKDSLWIFYYDNGNKEKIVRYRNDVPFLKEYYKKNGKPVFVEGNGKYKGTIISGYKQTAKYKISGDIKNGRFDGTWHWSDSYTSAVEYFKNGNFIRGSSYGLNYTTDPKISLIGFDLHEHVDAFKFIAVPRAEHKITDDYKISGTPVTLPRRSIETHISFNESNSNNQPLKYKGSFRLNDFMTPELEIYLQRLIIKDQIQKFWCFIQFSVSERNSIENPIVHSNNEVILNGLTHFISELDEFEVPKVGARITACDVYLSIFYENGTLHIPEYMYNNIVLIK